MRTRAFTLVELVVVITIIAILASIIIFNIGDYRESAEATAVTAYANEVKSKLSQSLLAEWKMEKVDAKKIYDSGRHSITGTATNTLTEETNCKEGRKCVSSQNAQVKFNSNNIPAFKFNTVCFWVKAENDSFEILKNSNDFKIYSDGGIIKFDVYSNNTSFISVPFSGTSLKDKEWHFICGSIDDTKNFSGTFDGELVVTKDVNVKEFGRNPIKNMCLGCNNYKFFIDDLLLFQEPL